MTCPGCGDPFVSSRMGTHHASSVYCGRCRILPRSVPVSAELRVALADARHRLARIRAGLAPAEPWYFGGP